MGSDTKDLLSLREKALVLRKYCDRASGNLDRSLFEFFSSEQSVDSILVVDENLHQEIKIGYYTGPLWNDAILSEQKIKFLQYPQKTYLEHITYKGRNYDVAIIFLL